MHCTVLPLIVEYSVEYSTVRVLYQAWPPGVGVSWEMWGKDLNVEDFLKVLEERSVFKSVIHFQKQSK